MGAEKYARYLDDCHEQEQLREMPGDKPKVITEYEGRLKTTTFAFSKADNKSVKGPHKTSTEMIVRHYSKYSPLLNAELQSGRKKKHS